MSRQWLGYLTLAVGAAAGGAAVTLLLTGSHTATVIGGAPVGSTGVAAPLPGTVTTGPPQTCAAVTSAAPAWPVAALKGLPTIKGATISTVQRQDGTLAVQFGAPTSFQDLAAQLRVSLPAQGYALFGGDQEAREADVRFISGSLTGGFKLVHISDCQSVGILAVVDPAAAAAATAKATPSAR